jgi:hypothetical protein
MASLLHEAWSMPPLFAAPLAGAAGQLLAFTMHHQEQTNWCWAAVATSTAGFYESNTGGAQCELVNAELGLATCCASGSDADCNVAWYLEDALQHVDHLRDFSGNKATWDTVTAEIDAGRALGVRIAWEGGGGHFVIVAGYDSNGEMLEIRDPWWGDSSVAYDSFPDTYQGRGSWTHSYRTQ